MTQRSIRSMMRRGLELRGFTGRALLTWASLGFSTLAVSTPIKNLTLAWEAEPRTVDPRFAVDANSQYLENLLHCALVTFDKDSHAIGGLASSWKYLTPASIEVKLRPEARFSDGSKVTAVDVKATYDSLRKPDAKTPSPRKGAFSNLKAITAKGADTVLFELSEPDSTFALNLVVGILPQRLSAKEMLTPDDGIVGCGPFILKSFASTHIELARNANYSLGDGGHAAKLEAVTIKIVKDEQTRYAKLKAGELDIVQNSLGRDKLDDLARKSPDLAVMRRQGLNTSYLGFNMKDPVVGKLEVRRAIAHAIDREKIIKYILNGLASPATTLLTPSDTFFDKSLTPPTYNPKLAMELLDKAGFPDPDGPGKKPRFSLTYKTTTDLTRVGVAKAIAADLRRVGIDVTVESLEWGRFKADVDSGKVQMWSLSWVGFKDPDIYRFAFATESFPPQGGNRGWYSNPELDKLLTAARMEPAQEKRKPLYETAQRLVAQDLPYIFLWHEEVFAVVRKEIGGFELFADGRYTSLGWATKN